MNLRSPSVLIAVVALLVLVGGGAAYATSQGGSGSSAPGSDSATPDFEGIASGDRGDMLGHMGRAPRFAQAASDYLGLSVSQIFERLANGSSLAQIAKAQGKSVEGLENAIVDGAESDLAKKVDEGWLTDQQRDRILSLLHSNIDEIVNHEGLPGPRFGPGGSGPGGMPGHPGPPLGMLPGVDEAAKYLGLSVDELTTRLRNGRSLAQIAKAQGKSVEGLKTAIVSGVESDLDKAVDEGKLPAQMKNQILKAVRSGVDDVVNGGLPSFGGPGAFDRHRFGPPGGFGPPGDVPDDSSGSSASFA